MIKKLFHASMTVFDACMCIYSGYVSWNTSGKTWVLWMTATIFWLREFINDVEEE